MAFSLIKSKISYNNALKLLEFAVPCVNYIDLFNHTSSVYYSTLDDALNELH
jgi:hypothetical protein